MTFDELSVALDVVQDSEASESSELWAIALLEAFETRIPFQIYFVSYSGKIALSRSQSWTVPRDVSVSAASEVSKDHSTSNDGARWSWSSSKTGPQ